MSRCLGKLRNNKCFCISWGYCVRCWLLEDKVGKGLSASVMGCLHRLGVKVVGHGDGS